jgi:hippurate hydrolase
VISLQAFVSREMDPTDSAVVTVGQFNAGTATNVIPDVATLEGTARTITPHARQMIGPAIERRCAGVAAANGCTINFEWIPGYPPTINDPAMGDYVARIAKQTVGAERYFPVPRPSMGGEDFAYYLEQVPGCFFLVGVEPMEHAGGYPPLHSDRYDFTDAAMAVGMRMFVELVRNFGR